MRWVIVTAVLMPLWMRQQQRPARNAGPLMTRPRRPRLEVVRWLSLDSLTLWRYTVFVKNAIASTLFLLLLLAPLLMLWSEDKTPTGLVTRWGFCFTLIAAL